MENVLVSVDVTGQNLGSIGGKDKRILLEVSLDDSKRPVTVRALTEEEKIELRDKERKRKKPMKKEYWPDLP